MNRRTPAPETPDAREPDAAADAQLPLEAHAILELAARSMFELFAGASQGMMLVDRNARVVWVNDRYKRFLPALGFEREEDFVGQPVSAVVQNTLMHRVLETGKPILLDLLTNRAGTFVVSRIPLRDAAGSVMGVLGIVLFDHAETHLAPLMGKFQLLQRELDDARRDLVAAQQREQAQAGIGNGARRAKHTFASFIGSSPSAVEVKRHARRAAASSSTVLLLGETGTGKELLAHAIHAASRRSAGPLVSVNIAAIPDSLLEAEFFGVAPGAFTGADRKSRQGKFELAHGGTLFLDEVGDMALPTQAKLLRALQEGEIEPLGSNRVIQFDARVIAATSRDLAMLVQTGRFRADLYYRLNVLPIQVPPLRERRSDMLALVEALCEDIAQRSGLPPVEVLPDAMALLAGQSWPGNIRELRNVLEQSALRIESGVVDAETIRDVLRQSGLIEPAPPAMPFVPVSDHAPSPLLAPLPEQVSLLERRAAHAAMRATKGNKLAASRLLKISRAKLYALLENPDQ